MQFRIDNRPHSIIQFVHTTYLRGRSRVTCVAHKGKGCANMVVNITKESFATNFTHWIILWYSEPALKSMITLRVRVHLTLRL